MTTIAPARATRMKRPFGYSATAVLLALGGVSGLMWACASPFNMLGLPIPIAFTVSGVTNSLAGLTAAWAIWTMRRWAPEAYASWMALSLGNQTYIQLAIMPKMYAEWVVRLGAPTPPQIPSWMALWGVAVNGVFLGLGYWYLVAKRPVVAPVEEQGAGSPKQRIGGSE